MRKGVLKGCGVLVTRPEHQSDELAHAIEDAGGEAIRFPVIDVVPEEAADVMSSLASLPAPDITIFISTNAVMYGLPYLDGDETVIAAIGPTTRSAIEAAGRDVDICPSRGFDSEHLLSEPGFREVSGKNVRIIRGDGGRELLADTLRERGARVHYVEVYRRQTRTYSPSLLSGLEQRWRDGQVNFVIAMSGESLVKLLEILPRGCREYLAKTPIVTPSARVFQTASDKIPGAKVIQAETSQTADMIRALAAYRQSESR
jgi:uroporphyrinogen-III synthase